MKLINLGSVLEISPNERYPLCLRNALFVNDDGSRAVHIASIEVLHAVLPWVTVDHRVLTAEIIINGVFNGEIEWDDTVKHRAPKPYVTKLWIEYDEDDEDTDARD